MDEESLKEVMNDIHYVNGKPLVFQAAYYDIKNWKTYVRTGG